MNDTSSLHNDKIERLARRRAGMRMGWLIHAAVFVAVNVFLAGLSIVSGRYWALYPFFGWGLGLAIHGAVVLLASPGNRLMERMVDQERQRLAKRDAR